MAQRKSFKEDNIKEERSIAEKMIESNEKTVKEALENLEIALKDKNMAGTIKQVEVLEQAIKMFDSPLEAPKEVLGALESTLLLLNKYNKIDLKMNRKDGNLLIFLQNGLIIKLNKENYGFEIKNSKGELYILDYVPKEETNKADKGKITTYITKVFQLVRIAMLEFGTLYVKWTNLKANNGQKKDIVLTTNLKVREKINIQNTLMKGR